MQVSCSVLVWPYPLSAHRVPSRHTQREQAQTTTSTAKTTRNVLSRYVTLLTPPRLPQHAAQLVGAGIKNKREGSHRDYGCWGAKPGGNAHNTLARACATAKTETRVGVAVRHEQHPTRRDPAILERYIRIFRRMPLPPS